jgi:hypothetical protein
MDEDFSSTTESASFNGDDVHESSAVIQIIVIQSYIYLHARYILPLQKRHLQTCKEIRPLVFHFRNRIGFAFYDSVDESIQADQFEDPDFAFLEDCWFKIQFMHCFLNISL